MVDMPARTFSIVASIIVFLLLAGVWFILWQSPAMKTPSETSSSTDSGASTSSLTLAGGEVSLKYSPNDFNLATTADQLLVRSYIPPCDPGFDYCFYYHGNSFAGTNFESAGLRIRRRNDLAAERLCLTTPPPGYTNARPSASSSAELYSASVFSIENAGAGHVASGDLYRLFVRAHSSCYEFETRVGNSQFANYPSGTVKEFTTADRQTLEHALSGILESATIAPGGSAIIFPSPKR